MPANLHCPTRRTARSGSTRRRWVMSRWSAVLRYPSGTAKAWLPAPCRSPPPGSCPTLFPPVSDGLVSNLVSKLGSGPCRGRLWRSGPPRPGTGAAGRARQDRLQPRGWNRRDWPSVGHASTLKSPRPAGRDGEEAPMEVEQRLEELGLILPGPPEVPPGFKFPFRWVRVWGGKPMCRGIPRRHPMARSPGPSARCRSRSRWKPRSRPLPRRPVSPRQPQAGAG
jgi:hypothetical protein